MNTITADCVDNSICAIQYHQFVGTTRVVACVTLKNGFTVTGEAACADPNAFDAETGEALALADAKSKIWSLLVFRLKDQLVETIDSDTGMFNHDAYGVPENMSRCEALQVLHHFKGVDMHHPAGGDDSIQFKKRQLLERALDVLVGSNYTHDDDSCDEAYPCEQEVKTQPDISKDIQTYVIHFNPFEVEQING